MNNDMTIYRAYLACRNCAESLLVAHHVPDEAKYHVEYALEQAQKMAEFLGYELVRGETPKVEEAA